ncbi:Type I Iterative PKS [Claviceps citrina]|nr:Type I Iterative PKS [Claviceps citrina]
MAVPEMSTNGHLKPLPAAMDRKRCPVQDGTNFSTTSNDGHLHEGQHQTSNGEIHDAKQPKEGSMPPMAICGMALRLPGGLKTAQQLWEFLMAKGDARTRVPESRYNVSAFHSKDGKQASSSVATEYGYFLDDSIDLGALDTSFFSMTRTEVERADPQQRLLLEVARECFDDAGITDWRGKPIACFVGSFGEDWLDLSAKETQPWGMYRVTGSGDFMLSNRISYEMDLRGPRQDSLLHQTLLKHLLTFLPIPPLSFFSRRSETIRAACSSSLICLHRACEAIARGECESALVGGVNLMLSPAMTMAMTAQGVLSKDGSCKTFSADADGYARGEAVTAVYVKSLADAVRDRDPIRAVIRGSAQNFDGKTPGISVPSAEEQETLMRRAYGVAGISDLSATAMVECHGTGTATGDPIEANAVARVFGDSGVYIGSVKPNLGHAEGASGLVSVIKAVLALEHRSIPPNIHFTAPNPKIPFEASKLTVPLEPTPWPENKLERVSINSFGIGGANAHVILDSSASFGLGFATDSSAPTAKLLLYSANTPKSLERMAKQYEDWVAKNPNAVRDVAYTLAHRREHLPHRSYAVFNNGTLSRAAMPTKATKKHELVMVFTGQGAQWACMGRELVQSDETFRSSIRHLDKVLRSQGKGADFPGYSIEEELLKPKKQSLIGTATLSQPLCTALQIALVDKLHSLGIVPVAVVGHSSGEIAAAYASGALTARQAILVAHHRGAITNLQKRAGAMAAIGMSWENTERFLVPGVTMACDNSPESVTISGDADAVKTVVAHIRVTCPDVLARLLQVDKAYHSDHMAEVGEQYLALIGPALGNNRPRSCHFFSSVTGEVLDASCDSLGATYWRDNLQSPVRFRQAVAAILQHDIGKRAAFVEIGPHGALSGPLRQILSRDSSSAPYVAVMTRNQHCVETLLGAVGKLHSLQINVDLRELVPDGTCLPDLPCYPWDHEGSYWHESRLARDWRSRKHPYHSLLGVLTLECTELEPVWRNIFHLENAPWVRDHRVGDDIVFPFAAYIGLVGEAVRQATGIRHGFHLRDVMVRTALVIPEGRPTELITTFRPHQLTDSLASPWWEFTVASYAGSTWNKHCVGKVMPLEAATTLAAQAAIEPLPRKMAARKWYECMQKNGLHLGAAFQSLQTVETSTRDKHEAIGTVSSGHDGDQNDFHVHPTVIDGTLQLLSAAAVHGLARKAMMWLPTSIESFSLVRTASNMTSKVTAKPTSNMSLVGKGYCVSDDGNVVLVACGIRMALAEFTQSTATLDSQAAARYAWASHFDFLDIPRLIAPSEGGAAHMSRLEDLVKLCIQASYQSASSANPAIDGGLQKYIRWIASTAENIRANLPASSDMDFRFCIQDAVRHLADTPVAQVASAMQQVAIGIDQLVAGEPLSAVVTDHVLSGVDKFIGLGRQSKFLRHLGHSKPNLRVLELGNGRTASSAKDVIDDLTLPNGQILCSHYTFTTPGFISAKDQQTVFKKMEYATLDISQDLDDQAFGDKQYDLILAVNVLHGNKSLAEGLSNVKKLLAPGGRLLLRDLCPSSQWMKYIFGSEPQWWCGEEDGRPDEPFVSKDRWIAELSCAGFEAEVSHEAVLDAPEPTQIFATFIATVQKDRQLTKEVTLLCSTNDSSGADDAISRELEDAGFKVTRCTLQDVPPAGQDVLCLLDRDGPFFDTMLTANFHALKDFIVGLCDAGVFWVTKLCQFACQDPAYAQVLGFARTMRSEMLIDFATCEMDSYDNVKDLVRVFSRFSAREGSDNLKADFEYAITEEGIKVGRFYPFSVKDELLVSEVGDRAVLDVATPGRIGTLQWMYRSAEELDANTVEVETHFVGLNFRDILVAMGIVELPVRQLGLEAAGIVTKTGSAVTDIKVGDRVACLKRHAFATTFTVPEFACVKIPDGLQFEEAGSMVVPYVTSIYSLVNIGSLRRGQSILIHSACGGVGLAALQIAKMIGADIIVTVGSDEKVQYLMENFGLTRERILHSRDDSFVSGVMRLTSGQGVDLVLNSLSGELLHATWRCVGEFGRMVEIGKRDLLGGGTLDMRPFLANRSFSCVDIDQLWKRPSVLKKLLTSTLIFHEMGMIAPIRPISVFDVTKIQEAFRYMQKGQHIGRIGISLESWRAPMVVSKEVLRRSRKVSFEESASYLLVGGLGGLGRVIATWMAENGAKELILFSRSAGDDPSHASFTAELESLGCNVMPFKGDVAKREDVDEAVKAAKLPLRGVLQMTMVLRDQHFAKSTFEEWKEVAAPKIQGTRNLHDATIAAGAKLDFFVMFSSLSGVVGQPGQVSYSAANTFLDAMAQYRNEKGLPASVIDIGAVHDIGYLTHKEGLMKKMNTAGFNGVSEQQLLDAVLAAILASGNNSRTAPTSQADNFLLEHKSGFVLGLASTLPLHHPENRALWRRDRRMAAYHNVDSVASAEAVASSNEVLKQFLSRSMADPATLVTPESANFLAIEIGRKLLDLLLKPHDELDTSRALVDLGLDSLVAIELRAWWKQVFHFDISVLEMLGMGSLGALGKHAADGLHRAAASSKE